MFNVGHEFLMTPSVWWMDDPTGKTSDQTDVYIEVGNLKTEEMPLTLQLTFVTGNANLSISGIVPKDMKRIGQFLIDTAKDIEKGASSD